MYTHIFNMHKSSISVHTIHVDILIKKPQRLVLKVRLGACKRALDICKRAMYTYK